MNSIKHRFTLDMHSVQSQISIPASIGDTARTLYISFTDGGDPYSISEGCTALLIISKPSGAKLEEWCAIKDNANVIYPFSQNKYTASEEGICECEITLYSAPDEDGDIEQIASPRFSIVVSERAINRGDDEVLPEASIGFIDQAVKDELVRRQKEQERQTAENARISAEAARAGAETDRANAESARATAETERASAESARKTAENARASAETVRATAETQRIANEAERQRNAAEYKAQVDLVREEIETWQDEWGKISSFDKRIENLEAAISPEIVTPVTDSTVAYTKTVPKGALPNAAITEIGGMSYVKNGAILDSKVTAVESVGANIVKGFNSCWNGNVTTDIDGKIHIIRTHDGGVCFATSEVFYLEANQPYTFRCDRSAVEYIGIVREQDSSNIEYVYSKSIISVSISGNYFLRCYMANSLTTIGSTASAYIWANKGNIDLPYSSYIRETFPIPADALDGFGQGVNAQYCNKIVLDPLEGVKKYVKMVKKIELNGTESMSAQNYVAHFTVQQFNILGPSDIKNGIDVLCNEATSGWNAFTGNANEIGVSSGYIAIGIPKALLTPYGYVDGTSSTYVSSFKAYLKAKYDNGTPITVAYAIATPVETDVSTLFADDNLLPVEAGGTITAVNEYEQAVPFSIEYTVKGA